MNARDVSPRECAVGRLTIKLRYPLGKAKVSLYHFIHRLWPIPRLLYTHCVLLLVPLALCRCGPDLLTHSVPMPKKV